jgi:hypothetical protein
MVRIIEMLSGHGDSFPGTDPAGCRIFILTVGIHRGDPMRPKVLSAQAVVPAPIGAGLGEGCGAGEPRSRAAAQRVLVVLPARCGPMGA